MDAQTGMDLWKKFVKNERLADYRKELIILNYKAI